MVILWMPLQVAAWIRLERDVFKNHTLDEDP